MYSKKILRAILVSLGLFVSTVAYSKSVTAIALFKDRAMLSVDGGKAKIVSAGKVHQGVKLVSSNTAEAVIEVNGKRDVLTLNGTAILTDELGAISSGDRAQVEIQVNELGFFESAGSINGRRINFLVDTGANLVVLSSQQANSIGLDYQNGLRSFASTASGTAPMYSIVLPRISLGGIQLQNIEAGVIEGSFPQKPLLGMTFLERLDMTRTGNLMTLKQR